MRRHILWSALLILFDFEIITCKIWDIPLPDQLKECYDRVKDINVESYVGSIFNWQCEHTLINAFNVSEPQMDSKTSKYLIELMDIAARQMSNYKGSKGNRQTRQATTIVCNRKEYRMLTLTERQAYHNAVNTLKADTSVFPNKYDSIANIHTGVTNLIAHGGPGFLGWHRFYMLIFEAALRQVNPTICLPYWDSTLDNLLPNPLTSSMWTADFMGTPSGPVVSGPFAGWSSPNRGQLIRNVGADGELLNFAVINNIMSRNRYEDIVTANTTDPLFDMELIHGTVHAYVGGFMAVLENAAFDPIFFLYHSFVDLLFEIFRARLTSLGVDPTVYPKVSTNFRHEATAPTGFNSTTQADGYSASLAARVTYEPVPTCSATNTTCGNRFLVCQLSSGKCVPTTAIAVDKRSIITAPLENTYMKPVTYGLPYQNSYCTGQSCDIGQWAMIPVKIVNVRPPKFLKYNSFPVKSGRVDEREDIYSPKAYNQTRKFIVDGEGNPKTYSHCASDTVAGQVFVYSHGLSYDGVYKESAIIDQRLPVSMSMGFVAVKRPTSKDAVTKVLLRAHDSCGRVCRVTCKDPVTNEFRKCSGAVALDSQSPMMYGANFDDAVMSVFDYNIDSEYPRFHSEKFYVTFFCDYRKTFPLIGGNRPAYKQEDPFSCDVMGGYRMRTTMLITLAVVLSCLDLSSSKIWSIPALQPLQECYNRVRNVSMDLYVGSLFSWFCEHMLVNTSSLVNSTETVEYLTQLYSDALRYVTDTREKRQAVNLTRTCVRKEYRMLTLEERIRYHNAIRTLKNDESVSPNKYDTIASIHSGTNTLLTAHGGPGFLGWHRFYLLIYETALRQVDSRICLPYWDSSLDNELSNPFLSSIWSNEFLGTPRGQLNSGPFNGFRLLSGSPVIRNVAVDGDLFSRSGINDIMSQDSYEALWADSRYNIEFQHNAVHVYVGGSMNILSTASFDPVFFLHHTFVDYVWQQFRDRLSDLGLDPSEYPQVQTNARHRPDYPMGFRDFKQEDGYSIALGEAVHYEPVPTCSRRSTSCGSRYLECQPFSGRCVPTARRITSKRSEDARLSSQSCSNAQDIGRAYQNDFCCNDQCDIAQWAIIPVKIITTRPPGLDRYDSYPVRNSIVDSKQDIYCPAAYNHTDKYITQQQGNPMTYSRCRSESAAGQVFVYSHGINYSGFYKESTIVDHKLPVSMSVAFVGVKRPANRSVTEALIRAHDSCGRVCDVACRDPDTKEFKPCSGAIALSEDLPIMFGRNFDEAVMSIFDYNRNKDCPKFRSENFFLTFYCDYNSAFPYAVPAT